MSKSIRFVVFVLTVLFATVAVATEVDDNLIQAATSGTLVQLQDAIAKKPSRWAIDRALKIVVRRKQADLVSALVDAGATGEGRYDRDSTALDEVVDSSFEDGAAILVRKLDRLRVSPGMGPKLYSLVSHSSDRAALIKKLADEKVPMRGGRFFDLMAWFSTKDHAMHYPLHYAASRKDKDSFEALLDNGMNIDAPKCGGGGTALHEAARVGADDIVQMALNRGAKIKRSCGQTAYHDALVAHSTQMIDCFGDKVPKLPFEQDLFEKQDKELVLREGVLHEACPYDVVFSVCYVYTADRGVEPACVGVAASEYGHQNFKIGFESTSEVIGKEPLVLTYYDDRHLTKVEPGHQCSLVVKSVKTKLSDSLKQALDHNFDQMKLLNGLLASIKKVVPQFQDNSAQESDSQYRNLVDGLKLIRTSMTALNGNAGSLSPPVSAFMTKTVRNIDVLLAAPTSDDYYKNLRKQVTQVADDLSKRVKTIHKQVKDLYLESERIMKYDPDVNASRGQLFKLELKIADKLANGA